MSHQIEMIFEVITKQPVAYVFHPVEKAQQAAMDMSLLDSLLGGVYDDLVTRGGIFFIPVSNATLEHHDHYTSWLRKLTKLKAKNPSDFVIQIGPDTTDDVVGMRLDGLHQTGAKFSMDEFGVGFSSLRRLEKYKWDYCHFDARRTALMQDALALVLCKQRNIKAIANRVSTQSESIISVLAGQDWQQGEYLHQLRPTRVTN